MKLKLKKKKTAKKQVTYNPSFSCISNPNQLWSLISFLWNLFSCAYKSSMIKKVGKKVSELIVFGQNSK